MSSEQTHVIVGASVAGAKAAETLRAEGFEGRVVLVGAEAETAVRTSAAVQGLPARRGGDGQGLRPRRGLLRRARHRAAARTPGGRPGHVQQRAARSTTTSGCATTACCSRPARSRGDSQCPALSWTAFCYLRSVEDSDALRERLDRGGAVVVVGAGWIGAEVAASARQRGLDVTVLDPLGVPLERVLGVEVGTVYRDIHTRPWHEAAHGRRGRGVRGRDRRRAGPDERRARARVRLRGRRAWASSRAPSSAANAGLSLENGIAVDDRLRTSAPAVFAAGDVANAYHPFYGERIRVEHWANALNQGPAAARNMLGGRRPLRPPAVLLLRPVRRRHGVLGLRSHLGSRGIPGRSGEPGIHRLLAGRGPRRRRDERERVGRDRAHPGSDPRSCAGR